MSIRRRNDHARLRATIIAMLAIASSTCAWGQLPKGIVVEKVDLEVAAEDSPQTPYLSLNINGHTGLVRAIEFSPDSKRLYTAGNDKVVHVWRPPGANPKAFVVEGVGWHKSHSIRWEIARGLRGNIWAMTVSPNGKSVAIAGFGARGNAGDIIWANGDDGEIQDIARGEHDDSVVGLDYSSDGRWMTSTDKRGRTMLWDVSGQQPVGKELQADRRLRFLSHEVFSGRSHLIVRRFKANQRAKAADGSIIEVPTFSLDYYNVNSGRSDGYAPLTLFREVTALAASRDGRFLAAGDRARRLYLYKRGDLSAPRLSESAVIRSLDFSGDGKYLAVGTMAEGGRASQVQVWDTTTRRMLFSHDLERLVMSVAISPDGKWLACSGGESFHVFVWELIGGRPIKARPTVLAGGDRITQIKTDPRAGSFVTKIQTNTGEQQTFDPTAIDDDPLAVAARPKAMVIERLETGPWSVRVRSGYRLQLYQNGVARGVIDLDPIWQGALTNPDSYCWIPGPDDDRPIAIAVGTDSQYGVFVYDLKATGKCDILRYFRGHSEEVNSIGVTGDRRFLVSGSADGTVRYWKLADLQGKAFFTRWGADVVLSKDRSKLIVKNCVDSGPLFHKGVRDGDVIHKIVWPSAETGIARRLSTVEPLSIYQQMLELPISTQLGMDIRRGEKQLPRFNVVAGWNPMLSVYIHNDDWIAWHPSGYYACSPGGARLIGWQVNEDIGRTPKMFPAVRFHESLYKPKEVSRLLVAGGLDAPELQSISQPPSPPLVELTSPARRHVDHDQPTIVVRARAKATGDDPLLSMQLLINGVPAQQYTKAMEVVAADRGARPMDWVEREWTVDLEPGQHSVAVRADTRASHAYSTNVTIAFQPAKAKRKLHLLVVAVNEYDDDAVSDLKFCTTDAARITEIFQTRGKGLFDEVVVTKVFNEKATRKGVEAAFESVANQAGMNDLVVLFYSGHGHRLDDRFYLVSHDANLGNLKERGVSEVAIKGFCKAIATKGSKMIIMIDACRSGAMRLERLTADLATDDFRVAMMASSKGDEYSYEHEKFGGGAFTQCLWLGMHDGEADQSMVADGRVDNDELGVYVRRKVQQLIAEIAPEIKRQYPDEFKDKDVRQTPVSNFQALDPIGMAILPQP